MKETLPERLELAKSENTPYQTFLELVLTDEMERRQRLSALNRSKRASLEREMTLEKWDESSKVTFDRRLFSELTRLRFIEQHYHVLLLGPVGVGKTFLANALGHIACRRGYSVLMMRAEKMLKSLKAARLDQTYDAEMRRLIHVALLIVDDLGLDQIDADASRDLYEIIAGAIAAGPCSSPPTASPRNGSPR
jgi:DNA replication protein DnaC